MSFLLGTLEMFWYRMLAMQIALRVGADWEHCYPILGADRLLLRWYVRDIGEVHV